MRTVPHTRCILLLIQNMKYSAYFKTDLKNYKMHTNAVNRNLMKIAIVGIRLHFPPRIRIT